ncbi:MAG: transposase, partial [Chloroflexota bacterium]|nr:transposase [Chloroflexota bacterium]
MTPADLERVADSFARFHATFAPLFGQRPARTRSEQYLRALLVQRAERRNAENLAEAVAGATPRTLQRFLTDSPWEARTVIAAEQAFLGPRLSTLDGVLICDETAAAKQGTHAVGVARQYSGTLGKVSSCQVGVYRAYASPRGQALIDGELYLPQAWIDDAARRRETGVPVLTTLATKGDLALWLLERAWASGHWQGRWVTGDAVYGSDSGLRDGVDAAGRWYVFDVRSSERVLLVHPVTAVPAWSGRGR